MLRSISLVLSISILSLFGFNASAAEKTVTLDVPGMNCNFCPITISKALKKVDGVIEAKSSFDTKTATVTFDEEKTSVKTLTEATASAGYPSTLKK